jgi:membrane-bound serine protease (ClpP class)
MAAELFVPTSGILFALAMCGLLGGVVMVFLYSTDPFLGWITLLGLIVAVPSAGRLLLALWPRTAVGRSLQLQGPDEDATIASMPVNVELEQLRGKIGRALSALRPGGVVDFEGKRIDTVTEGMMVEPGEWVRCIDVRAGRVVVRPVPKPDLDKLENLELD